MIVVVADINGGMRRRFELIDRDLPTQKEALITWLLDVLPFDTQMNMIYVRMWKEEWNYAK